MPTKHITKSKGSKKMKKTKQPKKMKTTKQTKKMKKTKQSKGKSRHTMHSIHNSSNLQHTRHQTLIDLITKLSEASNRKRLNKSQSNLPARLMQIPNRSASQSSRVFQDSSSKAVSSTFSSFTHNGHTHSKGKKIINDSKQPFIKIDEMKNGNVQRYMVPKDTIPYKKPTALPRDMNMDMSRMEMPRMQMDMHMPRIDMNMGMHMPRMEMPMHMPMHISTMNMPRSMSMPESSIIVYSTIGKQNKKTSKATKANKKSKDTTKTKQTKK